jgi:hypothetical protein
VRAARPLVLLAAFALPAIVYIASVSPEPGSWDTAELQGVPYILGISHPTGFPLYVLIGYAWSHIVAVGSIAWRMNAMSGVAMGITTAAACAVALELGASLPVAFAATLWYAFTPNIWGHANRAEAQDLAVMCCAVAMYAFVRWMHGASARWFAAAFALAGLGLAAHPNALWILPAFVAGAIIAKRRPPRRLAVTAFALLIAGLLLYAYLPLRSAYVVAHHLDPAATLAGARGGIFWNYNDPRTPQGLMLELSGRESETPGYFLASLNPLHIQSALWTFVEGLHNEYGSFATLLIFAGLIVAWRRDWRATLVLVVACTAGLLFSVVYPNESDVGRYRMLASWIAVPLLGALTPQSRRPAALALHVALALFLLAGAATTFARQTRFFRHPPGEGGRWVISAVAPWVPSGAVIVTDWLDATSLAYGAYAEGSLPGRIIVADDRLDIPTYRQWAKTHQVFVLVNPHDVRAPSHTRDAATLDSYHELYAVEP